MVYGFYDECLEKYNDDDKHFIYYSFINVFNYLSVAALINNSILAMHGGISPHIEHLSDLNKVKFLN